MTWELLYAGSDEVRAWTREVQLLVTLDDGSEFLADCQLSWDATDGYELDHNLTGAAGDELDALDWAALYELDSATR